MAQSDLSGQVRLGVTDQDIQASSASAGVSACTASVARSGKLNAQRMTQIGTRSATVGPELFFFGVADEDQRQVVRIASTRSCDDADSYEEDSPPRPFRSDYR